VNIRIRCFAVARQLAGRDVVALEVGAGTTIGQLRQRLAADMPELAAILPHVMFAVGSDYVDDAHVLRAESEVACIPPVSGG
jgi:molybdopterin converting factor subunit 1